MQRHRTALLILFASSPCVAHHGVAPHYDATKPVHLEGVVAKFDFINPHSFLYVDVVDAAGNKVTWSCEMASRSVLSRNGLTAERFEPGAKITIDGVAARHKATGCAFRTVHFADGGTLEDTSLFGPTRASAAEIPADSQRVVHLNGAAPADTPSGTMGYSTGRFDGNALVIDTDHFSAGTIEPRFSIMHTENLKLTERLEVNADGELAITFTIDDPVFFEEPYQITDLFVRSRWDPEPFNCKPGYQQ